MEFLPTKRGGTKLIFDGREYHYRKTYVSGNSFWECSKKTCKGNITLTLEKEKCKETPHSFGCLPNMAKCKIKKKMLELKDKICKNYDPIQKQFEEVICELKDDGIDLLDVELPKFENIKSGLHKARNKHLKVKKLHHKLPKNVEIPEKLKKYLFADYNDKIRIIIFCSPDIQKFLDTIEIYMLDGTFKSCPPPFKQLYSIHGYNTKTKKVIPLFFALMQNRKQNSYEILFRLIKSRISTWSPSKILLDYEKPAINAIRKAFPNATIKGCYYHLCHSLFNKAKKVGANSRVERRHVARCAGLARLPFKFILSGYRYVMKRSPKTDSVKKFNSYFDRFWLSEIQFIKMWCCQEEELRTTNYVEGWHSRLNRYVKTKNPSIAKVLDFLEKELKIKTPKKQDKETNAPKERQHIIDEDDEETNAPKNGQNIMNEDDEETNAPKKRQNITGEDGAAKKKKKKYEEIDEEINAAVEELKKKEISVGHCLEIIAPFVF